MEGRQEVCVLPAAPALTAKPVFLYKTDSFLKQLSQEFEIFVAEKRHLNQTPLTNNLYCDFRSRSQGAVQNARQRSEELWVTEEVMTLMTLPRSGPHQNAMRRKQFGFQQHVSCLKVLAVLSTPPTFNYCHLHFHSTRQPFHVGSATGD